MKKIIVILVCGLIATVFIGTAVFLYQKSKEKPVVYETVSPFYSGIVKKTVATGKIVPRREIEIKSQVSGVVSDLYVTAGQEVERGAILAKIEIIPDMERLNAAESQLESARLSFENSQKDMVRQKQLFDNKLIAEFEYNKFMLDFQLQKEALKSAENNVALIKEGVSKNSEKVSNVVWATVTGTVLDVPVEVGTFVTETNTFNAGTTIATIANMQDMIFEGMVDESEVGKIREGMDLVLNVGAIDGYSFDAVLEYISPKGVEDQGTIKFEIRAAVALNEEMFLRAGYSANADIVLEKRANVLAINEGNVMFEDGVAFVEVEVSEQTFEKRNITLGLSDGINAEIVSGLTEDKKIKKQ